MPGPSSLCMIDIVRENQEKKQQQFVQDTEDFPCFFNLGNCKLDIGSQKYTGQNLCELDIPKNKWKSLLEDLNNDREVGECEEEVWRVNLLTYVHAELGEYGEAFKLNKTIKDQPGMNNLVALVNAAFLFFITGNVHEAYAMLDDLKKLKSDQQTFADLKIDAFIELGYAFCELAGAKNLQFSISFLEIVLLFRPCDEQIQLMLAIVYRRCTHFNIYSADPENINRHDFALKAATSLFKLGTTSKNLSFKAAALIELAYLKYNDDISDERNGSEIHRMLSREEWSQIVQQRTWKQLCEEALEVCDDGPSEKVLKIAGQLYRYYGGDECLQKSEQLLQTAIAKRPTTRAHHHLALTYKKMAVRHDNRHNTNATHLENTQGAVGGYNVKPGWQYKPHGFANNTVDMKPPNRGNYSQRFVGRQKYTKQRGGFNNNARGGYTSNGVKRNPQVFVNSTTEMNHTSRGYHQQGFVNSTTEMNHTSRGYHQQGSTYNNMEMRHSNRGFCHQRFNNQSDHNTRHQILENNTQGTGGCGLKVLPEPPINNSPQQLDEHLKYITKVPSQFKPFSKDNPYTDKAIDHLKQAVELSCYQNKVAVYDLACILFKTEDYKKSKETCKILINESTSSKTLTSGHIYLVNAYNLYGICCAKEAEAEVNQENKVRHVAESEEYLTVAVRLASCLAASVPELEMCATDLWNAFRTLQKKFKFEGQKENRQKLFRICECISDYRFLEAVDDIVSRDPSELQKIEVIEQCLQRYLNMKAYDSALLLRDLVILLPGVKSKLSNSKVYRQLVLEVAEGKLDETYLERNTGARRPDHVWKQLFIDEFCVTGNSKKYDIVIVSDVDDDYELKRGMMSDISEYLKLVLLKTFGLNVVRAHEEAHPGCMYLEQQLQVISNSHVSLFVLTAPYTGSLSLVSETAGLRISETQRTVPESAAENNESKDCCTPGVSMDGNQNENENSLSRMYEMIISASISDVVSNVGATRMMLVVPYSLKLEDLPRDVRGLPNIVLTQSEIDTLIATTPFRSNEQSVNLMKKIFKAVLSNCEV